MERAACIEILGIPLHCWNYQTFKRVPNLWGDLIAMGDNLTLANNFEKMDILILIKQAYKIDELIMLERSGGKTNEIQKKNGYQMVREEDASSEVGSTNKSELKMSPEGRRNDGDEGVIETCLDNEGNDNEVQSVSAETFNMKNKPFSNVMSVPEVGEANGVSLDRGLEELNNLGLMVALDQNKGHEIQRMEENETGLVEKVMQIAGNKGSPKPNPISSFFSETEEPRDWDVAFEIEEGFFQLRQNKRNKKVLKMKIRSMREL
ncbi:hypothetical protein J1N35_008887 [Gossypium stocksii]|uniref:DUF4283 domain-containing protein n=1 Tax=Gossypium stocksii TaxID=47602 RepID=A0A9D3W8M1_9ROSI|nr:hypothetical protein J1N35_008887 [Gossypium stocksii]